MEFERTQASGHPLCFTSLAGPCASICAESALRAVLAANYAAMAELKEDVRFDLHYHVGPQRQSPGFVLSRTGKPSPVQAAECRKRRSGRFLCNSTTNPFSSRKGDRRHRRGDLGALACTAQNETRDCPLRPTWLVEVKPDIFLQFSHRRVVRGQHRPECGLRAIDAHGPAKDRETQRIARMPECARIPWISRREGRAIPSPSWPSATCLAEPEFPRPTPCFVSTARARTARGIAEVSSRACAKASASDARGSYPNPLWHTKVPPAT